MSDQRVCVIGAGVIGLSVALYLAEERIRTASKRGLQIGMSPYHVDVIVTVIFIASISLYHNDIDVIILHANYIILDCTLKQWLATYCIMSPKSFPFPD
jgi:flavin-dependent dehydrogenase